LRVRHSWASFFKKAAIPVEMNLGIDKVDTFFNKENRDQNINQLNLLLRMAHCSSKLYRYEWQGAICIAAYKAAEEYVNHLEDNKDKLEFWQWIREQSIFHDHRREYLQVGRTDTVKYKIDPNIRDLSDAVGSQQLISVR